MAESIGKNLGQYTLVRLLAHGGMSEVYLAYDKSGEQNYALKILKQTDKEDYVRFQQEVQAQSALIHPHIIPILDYGEQGGSCYYVMPYMRHGTLKERLVKSTLESTEVGEILIQMADALQYMHDMGIVHRDVKPANILLDEKNQVWLADFGLARDFEAGSDLTDTGSLIGTPYYMAPELVDRAASPSSDIYALGVVLYEMLTGRVPFKGKTPVATCWQHIYDSPPWPSSFNPLITPAIEKVIMRALEKKPHARFANAQGFAEAYQRALTRTSSAEDERKDSSGVTINIKPVSTVNALLQRHRSRSRSVVAASVAVAMLFMLGAVGLGMICGASSPAIAGNTAQMISIQRTNVPTMSEIPVRGTELTPSASKIPVVSQKPSPVKPEAQAPTRTPPPAHSGPVIPPGKVHNPPKKPSAPPKKPAKPAKHEKPKKFRWPWQYWPFQGFQS